MTGSSAARAGPTTHVLFSSQGYISETSDAGTSGRWHLQRRIKLGARYFSKCPLLPFAYSVSDSDAQNCTVWYLNFLGKHLAEKQRVCFMLNQQVTRMRCYLLFFRIVCSADHAVEIKETPECSCGMINNRIPCCSCSQFPFFLIVPRHSFERNDSSGYIITRIWLASPSWRSLALRSLLLRRRLSKVSMASMLVTGKSQG